MIREVTTVSINGENQADLIPDISDIEVEEHVDSADVFRVRISLAVNRDGTWTHADDPRFALWNQLQIVGGYPEDNSTLLDGYITHVKLSLSGPGDRDSYLELSGMDGSAVMDLEDKQVAFPNKKDSDIAQQVFASHGMSWEVEDTQLVHDEKVATILQSESDIRFLRRLAARNGFECYVQGKRGFFRSPNFTDPPQKILAIQFGDQTNLASLEIEVDGTPPTALNVRRIDPFEKQDNQEQLLDLPRRALGDQTLKALRAAVPDGRRLIKHQPAAGDLEMKSTLRAGYEPAGRFVGLSGEIDSRAYRAVLHAKKLVTIKGASSTHSGLYYVTRVRHRFTAREYTQSFEAHRNGIGLTGEESFATPPELLPALPGASTGASTGNRLLPATSTGGLS